MGVPTLLVPGASRLLWGKKKKEGVGAVAVL
jgi:hypothetical protein